MRKIVNQIRNLDLIEKELNSNMIGVLALNVDEDKVVQTTTTYIYLDKNIYIFFGEKDELYNSIKFRTDVNFTILKTEKTKKTPKADFTPTYHIFSISISGLLKEVDDQKTKDDLRKNYLEKYSSRQEERERNPAKLSRVVLIDSREIQAIEEIGG